MRDDEKSGAAIAGITAGCGLIVGLAMLGVFIWAVIELVLWVTSK